MSRADYAHWNEEQDIVWWNEEGKHEDLDNREWEHEADEYEDRSIMSKFYLKRTVGSWSGGTEVELLSPSAFNMPEGVCEVRILAGDRPIIEVAEDDLVERGRKSEQTSIENV